MNWTDHRVADGRPNYDRLAPLHRFSHKFAKNLSSCRCSFALQPVFWGCELQAVGQDLGAQCLPPQLEGGGGEGHPYRPHLPQHGLQGSHFIHHIVVNSSLKEDGAVLVDMSLFTKPTITCNMDFSLFPFDVQRCLLKIQVWFSKETSEKNLSYVAQHCCRRRSQGTDWT